MCAADSGRSLFLEAVHSRGSGATVPNDLEEPGQDSFFGEIRLQDFGAVVLKSRYSDGTKALERRFLS